jgi:hypothetical protein
VNRVTEASRGLFWDRELTSIRHDLDRALSMTRETLDVPRTQKVRAPRGDLRVFPQLSRMIRELFTLMVAC